MDRFTLQLYTEGHDEIIDLTPELSERIAAIGGRGLVHLFVIGSTVALTTMEYEPGLIKTDIREALQRLIPDNIPYAHEATWNDDNGHSHVRASLVGPDLTIPFENGRLMTGEYQQVVLLDFDTTSRKRTVVVTILT